MRIKIIFLITFIAFNLQAQTNIEDLFKLKRYDQIITYVDTLKIIDSTDLHLVNTIAECYEKTLHYQEALEFYEIAHLQDTTNLETINSIARLAANIGLYDKAYENYNRLLQKDSTSFYNRYQLARLYYNQNEYQNAIDHYSYLAEKDTSNAMIYYLIGNCYYQGSDKSSALFYYSKAYQLRKSNINFAHTLINKMLELGNNLISQQALTICDSALFYNPNQKLLLRDKAMGLYSIGEYFKADTIYTQLLQSGDSCFSNLKYGGSARYYAELYSKAIELLEPAWQQDTTSVEINLLLGSALGKTYDRKKAYNLYNRAEEAMQTPPALLNLLDLFRADTYIRDGKILQGNSLYYKVWKKDETRINLLYNILSLKKDKEVAKLEKIERQKDLYINMLYGKKILQQKKDPKKVYNITQRLEEHVKDLFFRNKSNEIMITPDNAQRKVTLPEIQELIKKLNLFFNNK